MAILVAVSIALSMVWSAGNTCDKSAPEDTRQHPVETKADHGRRGPSEVTCSRTSGLSVREACGSLTRASLFPLCSSFQPLLLFPQADLPFPQADLPFPQADLPFPREPLFTNVSSHVLAPFQLRLSSYLRRRGRPPSLSRGFCGCAQYLRKSKSGTEPPLKMRHVPVRGTCLIHFLHQLPHTPLFSMACDHLGDQAPGVRRLGIDLLAGENHLHGAGLANGANQPLGAAACSPTHTHARAHTHTWYQPTTPASTITRNGDEDEGDAE